VLRRWKANILPEDYCSSPNFHLASRDWQDCRPARFETEFKASSRHRPVSHSSMPVCTHFIPNERRWRDVSLTGDTKPWFQGSSSARSLLIGFDLAVNRSRSPSGSGLSAGCAVGADVSPATCTSRTSHTARVGEPFACAPLLPAACVPEPGIAGHDWVVGKSAHRHPFGRMCAKLWHL